MKAIVRTKYGLPNVLELREVEKPVPKGDEVLIQIYAVSLNASDYELLTGKPLYARIYGLIKPKIKILGSDIAGRVDAVGNNVKSFKAGDEVFGDIFDTFGGFAEYVCAPENKLKLKPASLSFEQAAAIPQSAVIALQGLLEKGRLGEAVQKQQVLINGAGGGAGSFAIQMAKYYGAEVTVVDNTEKLEMMRRLGADYVIDYTKQDFTKNGKKYDFIFDLAAHHSIFNYKNSLKEQGSYAMVGGSMARVLQFLLFGPLISMTSKKKLSFLALKTNEGLQQIIEFYEAGKVIPEIDKCYTLSDVPEALAYLGQAHARGKVVIALEQATSH